MGNANSSIDLIFDPGEDTGWSRYDYGRLVRCGLVHPDQYVDLPEIVGVAHLDPRRFPISISIEGQEIYRQSRQKGDPNNIVVLAQRAGAIGMALKQFYKRQYGILVDYKFIDPIVWKGSRDKTICHAQMLPALIDLERAVLDVALKEINKSQKLDVKDSVCLGLWKLRRAR